MSHLEICELMTENGLLKERNDRLVAALKAVLDPPSTLNEPETDIELILNMRRIAREAIAVQQSTEKP